MLFEALSGGMSFVDFLIYALSSLIVIFLVTPLHEAAHAFTANKLGDKTAKYMGRLTLNPFAHIDYIGALCILAFGFGWAKPVPVNMNNFKKPKRDMAITALAGPLANLLVALVAAFIYNLIFLPGLAFDLIRSLILYIIFIDVNLAIFNLIPIPPLDGSRLLNAFLPDRIYYKLMKYERYSFIIVIVLINILPLGEWAFLLTGDLLYLTGLPLKLLGL